MICQRTAGLGLATALLFVVGCSENQGPIAPVTGTVTYHGEPVEGAIIAFLPEVGRPAFGTTDASGRFTLSTFRPGDGAAPGFHMVAISAADVGLGPIRDEPDNNIQVSGKKRSPERYATPDTSGFTAMIEMEKTNDLTFDMVD